MTNMDLSFIRKTEMQPGVVLHGYGTKRNRDNYIKLAINCHCNPIDCDCSERYGECDCTECDCFNPIEHHCNQYGECDCSICYGNCDCTEYDCDCSDCACEDM